MERRKKDKRQRRISNAHRLISDMLHQGKSYRKMAPNTITQIAAVMLRWEPVRSSTTLARRSCSLKPIFTGGKSLFCTFTDHRAYQQLQNAANQPNHFFLKKAIFSEKWKLLVKMENLSKSWEKINSYIRDEMLHHQGWPPLPYRVWEEPVRSRASFPPDLSLLQLLRQQQRCYVPLD